MDLTSKVGKDALAMFGKEVDSLKGDALLERKIAFDQLPSAPEGERDLRLYQSLTLESTLQREFGLSEWQKALEAYKNRPRDA